MIYHLNPNSKYLSTEEKMRLREAQIHGYGVFMPGQWAERLMNEIEDLVAINEALESGRKEQADKVVALEAQVKEVVELAEHLRRHIALQEVHAGLEEIAKDGATDAPVRAAGERSEVPQGDERAGQVLGEDSVYESGPR